MVAIHEDVCPACHGTNFDPVSGACLNVNCHAAQEAATFEATRLTAKATATYDRPLAFGVTGRVD